MIKTLEETSFLLDFFEGPLDLLLYLVQKEEVNISQVTLQSITEQIRAPAQCIRRLKSGCWSGISSLGIDTANDEESRPSAANRSHA